MSPIQSSHPGNIFGHAQAHVAEIKARYPTQFDGEMERCAWPDGWHPLVVSSCTYVAKHLPELRWHSVKEVRGYLRLRYVDALVVRGVKVPPGIDYMLCEPDVSNSIMGLHILLNNNALASRRTCSLCGVYDKDRVRSHTLEREVIVSCDSCEPGIRDYCAHSGRD